MALLLGLTLHPNSQGAIWLLCKLCALTEQNALAEQWLERFLILTPNDDAALIALAKVQDRLGKCERAQQTLEIAVRSVKSFAHCFALSVEADRQGASDLAMTAITGAITLQPNNPLALLQQARVLQSTGKSEKAAQIYWRLIKQKNNSAAAWFALMDIKTIRLSTAELIQLKLEAEQCRTDEEQIQLNFALGKAYEDSANFSAAFKTFVAANQFAAKSNPWNAAAFERHIAAISSVFSAAKLDSKFNAGSELIFLVGLPRSGTTLVEQVLAAHACVEGAGELPHLPQLIQDESFRRGKQYPFWVPEMREQDWQRLAAQYLQRTAKWRKARPISTDKLPENWLYVGAIMRMFPRAKVIDCLRDATETAWSCYKQLFAPGRVAFSYQFENLGVFWHAYREIMAFWTETDAKVGSGQIYSQSYEHLITDQEAQIRKLLFFCNLPFDPNCLQAHQAQRSIRTPSAAQVRQPMTAPSIKTVGYGILLDDLRKQFSSPGNL